MNGVWLPPLAIARRWPAVRVAALAVVVLPLVTWWGGETGTVPRLRAAAGVIAVVLALVWPERCTVIAATPVGRPAVQRGRAVLVVGLLAAAWGLAALTATSSAQDVPVAPLALEAAALAAVVSVIVSALARDRDGDVSMTTPVLVLLAVVALQTRLPEPWQLLSAGPSAPGAPERLARVLVIAVAVLAWTTRDPAVRGLGLLRLGPVLR